MDQYTLNIFGNDGTVNVEFKELLYKLAANEILLGRSGDFPGKKNISKLIDVNDIVMNNVVTIEDTDVITPTTGWAFKLDEFIETYFYEEIDPYNSGVHFLVDFYFSFNHMYVDRLVPANSCHYAGSQHIRTSFTVYRTKLASETYKGSDVQVINDNGTWIKYDSSTTPYESIIASGELDKDAFDIYTNFGARTPTLNVTNELQSLLAFSGNPEYAVNMAMKLMAYEISQDDHTIELI